jgi:hypothetical protein
MMADQYDFWNDPIGWAAGKSYESTKNVVGWFWDQTLGPVQDKMAEDLNSWINEKTAISDDEFYQDRYDFKYRVFPEDLTNNDIGHYMVININTPTSITGSGEGRSAYQGAFYRTQVLPNDYSKVDILRFGTGPNSKGAPKVAGVRGVPFASTGALASQSESMVVPRATRRIQESIALFMPTPIIYSTQNAYENASLTALGGSVITGALSLAGAGVSSMSGAGAAVGAAAAGWGVADAIRGVSGAVGFVNQNAETISRSAAFAKHPINSRVEVLFATTPLREFVFEVLMAPKSPNESFSMEEIIRTLRQHAAPEVDPTTYGLTWIPPAEFDITFYNKGKENLSIPRINTCVLTRIDVDYSPQGVYATFKNGHPVACRLTLGFTELEVLHKRRVLQGF